MPESASDLNSPEQGVMCLLAPQQTSDSNPKNSVTHIYAFLINTQSSNADLKQLMLIIGAATNVFVLMACS